MTEPTILPDGSAFSVLSLPLPEDHWLYREYVYYAGNFDGESDELRDLRLTLVAERDALKAELERLTNCLKKANDQAEDFERRWYLADMELERIKALPPVAWARIPRFTGSAQTPIVVVTNPHSTAWTALYALGSKT